MICMKTRCSRFPARGKTFHFFSILFVMFSKVNQKIELWLFPRFQLQSIYPRKSDNVDNVEKCKVAKPTAIKDYMCK